jgi:hypothetical protein
MRIENFDREIVLCWPPYGRSYAKQLVLLRSFIEHSLFANEEWCWNNEIEKDPVWQAIYHFTSLVVRAYVDSTPNHAIFSPVVPFLAGGKHLPSYLGYPSNWVSCRHEGSLLPSAAIGEIIGCCQDHGIPVMPEPISPLPLTEFEKYLRDHTPREKDILLKHQQWRGDSFICLDDGQFVFGTICKSPDETEGDQPESTTFRTEVCRLWLRDVVRGIPLRNIVTASGHTMEAAKTLATWLPSNFTEEVCFLVLSAVAKRLWPAELGEFAWNFLIARAEKDRTRVESFLRRPEIRSLGLVAPPELTWILL